MNINKLTITVPEQEFEKVLKVLVLDRFTEHLTDFDAIHALITEHCTELNQIIDLTTLVHNIVQTDCYNFLNEHATEELDLDYIISISKKSLGNNFTTFKEWKGLTDTAVINNTAVPLITFFDWILEN